MRNILAIGAYERDNFGDYLFYEVLKRALPRDNIIPGSVIAGDMRGEYGFVTVPYDFVLKNYEVDAIWVVGGEVGGVDIPSALEMSVGSVFKDTPYTYNDDIGEKVENLLGASRDNNRAYIPDRALYARNEKKPLIIQSVGIKAYDFNEDNKKLLSSATRLVVRDSSSKDLCENNGVKAKLSPDVVHSLSKLYKPKKINNGGILLQVNKATLDKYEKATIRKILEDIQLEYKLPITLFAAGTANGHDSFAAYNSILDGLKGLDVKILDTRKPLDIVDHLASARIVIGTSLHARVVAATYNTPRISLENEKTQSYAEEWDGEWPSGVPLDKLIDTLSSTDFMSPRGEDNKLSDIAYQELLKSVDTLGTKSANEKLLAQDLAFDWYKAQQMLAVRSTVGMKMKHDIEMHRVLEENANKTQAILESRNYKTGRAILKPARQLQKIIKRNRTRG